MIEAFFKFMRYIDQIATLLWFIPCYPHWSFTFPFLDANL